MERGMWMHTIQADHQQSHQSKQVLATDFPDLTLLALLDPDGAHPVHAGHEGLEEPRLVGGEPLHERPGPRVQEQRLVRGQQAQPGLQVGVVRVVELERRAHVEGHHHAGASPRRRARHAQRLDEARVHERVRLPRAAEVVDAAEHVIAVREPDGVRAGERHQVPGVQALGCEHAEELVHRGVGAREAAAHLARQGHLAVPPALLHGVVRPTCLQDQHEILRWLVQIS
jgi:hypothetical protein